MKTLSAPRCLVPCALLVTLLLAPMVNLGAVQSSRAKLVALPVKIAETCATPCRALIIEED